MTWIPAAACGGTGATTMGGLRLLIFDMDGVLVDTSPCHRRAFAALWEELGIEGPAYERIAGRPTVEVVREWLPAASSTADGSDPEERLRRWVEFKQRRALRCLRHRSVIYDDTDAALAAVAAPGRLLAVGTGASRVSTDLVLRRAGLRDRFRHVVTAADVEAGKPAPDTFLLVMERAGVGPSDTLVIEDSDTGVRAGIASGARVLSVRSGVRADHRRFLGAFDDLESMVDELGLDGDGEPGRDRDPGQ